jgi:hypothetical protein
MYEDSSSKKSQEKKKTGRGFFAVLDVGFMANVVRFQTVGFCRF